MTSVFTRRADLTPYKCLPARIALDEMNPPLASLEGRQLWAARQSLAMNWSHPDDIRADVLNRILWWDAKGYRNAVSGEITAQAFLPGHYASARLTVGASSTSRSFLASSSGAKGFCSRYTLDSSTPWWASMSSV